MAFALSACLEFVLSLDPEFGIYTNVNNQCSGHDTFLEYPSSGMFIDNEMKNTKYVYR